MDTIEEVRLHLVSNDSDAGTRKSAQVIRQKLTRLSNGMRGGPVQLPSKVLVEHTAQTIVVKQFVGILGRADERRLRRVLAVLEGSEADCLAEPELAEYALQLSAASCAHLVGVFKYHLAWYDARLGANM